MHARKRLDTTSVRFRISFHEQPQGIKEEVKELKVIKMFASKILKLRTGAFWLQDLLLVKPRRSVKGEGFRQYPQAPLLPWLERNRNPTGIIRSCNQDVVFYFHLSPHPRAAQTLQSNCSCTRRRAQRCKQSRSSFMTRRDWEAARWAWWLKISL